MCLKLTNEELTPLPLSRPDKNQTRGVEHSAKTSSCTFIRQLMVHEVDGVLYTTYSMMLPVIILLGEKANSYGLF